MSQKSVLIAGCGFLGLAVARRFHELGWKVIGLTHSAETASGLAAEPFAVTASDIADPAVLGPLASEYGPFDVVVHCASSGKGDADDYRRVYFEGARHLLETIRPGFMIFTSSTSVYAQLDGGWVTEESPAEPQRETGRILRQAEELVLASGGVALRLSALYGAGRSVLLRKFFQGQAVIEGAGSRWINQIHRDDAATAVVAVAERNASGLFNVSDDSPLQQSAVYGFLAERFDRALPPTGEPDKNRKRGFTDKRIANGRLRGLGWQPGYPSFFDAVDQDPTLVEGVWSGA